MKKIISFIFVFLVCLGCLTLTVRAEDENIEDGIVETEQEKYSIEYVYSGFSNPNPYEYTAGQEIVLQRTSRPGFIFLGWYLDEDFTLPITKIDATMKGDLVLYANWQLQTYSIVFNSNGGEEVETIFYTMSSETIYLPEITRDGYEFLGWYKHKKKYTEVQYGSSENMLFEAQWKPYVYTITFDTDGGSEIEPITQDCGTKLEVETPTKEGYVFKGWEPELPDTMPAGGLEVKAVWELKKYKVSFDSNGGETIPDYEVDINLENGYLLPAPHRIGHEFLGWFDENGDEVQIVNKDLNKDIVLKASWEAKTYDIFYVLYDGVNNVDNKTSYKYGEKVNLLEPTKKEYKFLGWYLDKTFTEESKIEFISKENVGDLYLFAKWEKVKETEYSYVSEKHNVKFFVLEKTCRVVIDENEEEVFPCEIKNKVLYLYNNGEVITLKINEDSTLSVAKEEDLFPCQIKVVKSEFGDVIIEKNWGNIGDIVTFKVKTYIFYKIVTVKVNDTDLISNENGEYSFSLTEGINQIYVTYEVDNEQLELIAKNIAYAKNGDWETMFTFENLAQIVSWFITIVFSSGFLIVLLKSKKIQAKTTDEVIGITNDTIKNNTSDLIGNFLSNQFAPIVTKIDDKLVGTEEICRTLARCFVLGQENTPESRLAIISELTKLQKSDDDLSKQVKTVILEEMQKIKDFQKNQEETIKELEKQNESIKPDKIKDVNGRY